MEKESNFLSRWERFSSQHSELAQKLDLLAQKLLEHDRIDAEGVSRTIKSDDMKRLREFLIAESSIADELQISDLSEVSILESIDLYAQARIYSCERR